MYISTLLLMADQEASNFEEAEPHAPWRLSMLDELKSIKDKKDLVSNRGASKLKCNWSQVGIPVEERCSKKRGEAQGTFGRKGICAVTRSRLPGGLCSSGSSRVSS